MYQPVPKVPDFPALERDVLRFWEQNQTFAKLRAQNAGKEKWSFLDGPITANNPMGVHHAWGRTLKDMYQRYHAMNGKELRYQNGFDCQGLWVEVEVEKSLGLGTKRDIADYGMDKFVRACKERVLTFATRQTEQSIRLGYWCDWDKPEVLLGLRDALADGDRVVTFTMPSGKEVTARASEIIGKLGSAEYGGSYFTFANENNYTIWSFLKKCHSEGFIYRGHDVMPWCGRCGTGLSQMEVAEGRKITQHTSVFVRFPILGEGKTALLVWTTTPWTLTSNVAAAVNPEMTYLKVRHGEWTYYIGKGNFERDRVQDLQVEGKHETHKLPSIRTILKGSGTIDVLGEVPGAELVGLRYTGPFDELPAQNQARHAHRVVPWTDVSDAEGTGIVHIAPGCGAEDQELGKTEDLAVIAPLGENARFLDGFGAYTGRHASEIADDIVAELRERGLLVSKEKYPHVYPHCWRCKEELIFRPVDEWFIRMDWRDRIQNSVPTIKWIPSDGEAREQDWLKNMGDWMISKKRFWGLALPIWVCGACHEFQVIGGYDELKSKAIEGWDEFEGHTPHRPFIDKVKLRCEHCGGTATRVEDVGNPWLDAGIVPFSTMRYTTDNDYWAKWFPADLVLESFPGQFRNWFYSMLAMSAMLVNKAPFKALLGHGLVRDARGEEMHKSKGNSIAFDEAAEVLGAEVMRYIYAEQKTSQHLNFPDLKPTAGQTIDGEARRKLLTFWNCYSFFVMYASADGWKPSPDAKPSTNELDRWVLSRLQRLVADAHGSFQSFEHYKLIERFQEFDEDFSNWYLRRSRRRFWQSDNDAYQTLYTVLTTVIRLMAPVLPFLTEHVYQNLVRAVDPAAPESVHLTAYPVADESLMDADLETSIAAVIRIKNLALHLRTQSKVKVRQPLSVLTVRPKDEQERKVLENEKYAAQILEEGNIQRLALIEDEGTLVKARLKPDLKKLGPRAGKHLKAISAAFESATLREVRANTTFPVHIGDEVVEVAQDEYFVFWEGPATLQCTEEGGTFLALDTTLTPELLQEGIARDFNRLVQDQRKALNLQISDRIAVRYQASARIADAVETHVEYLKGELLAESIRLETELPDAAALTLGGEPLAVALSKVS
ncbi:class I tRNA ligase family protein [uncultured Paludibaculum sp.]|uniref:class I tRNA ligase family protein n=1 Tax=uncultured Paludibaculum sp. TaxID=1765020 RepID=UPI002AAA75C1|nr:class I tRNA ligase family protein [uncultured Paludibaculum sp.]